MGRRRRGEPPSYRLHKHSGQAVVSLPLGGGRYRDVLLGTYGTPDSHQRYAQVLAEWESSARVAPAPPGRDRQLTVNELILAYFTHAQTYYRHPDGRPTTEVDNVRLALRPLRQLYGSSWVCPARAATACDFPVKVRNRPYLAAIPFTEA